MRLRIKEISRAYGMYVLLGADFMFSAASLFRSRLGSFVDEEMLSVSADGGYAESFQYLKLAAIIILLGVSAIGERSAAIGGWAIVFTLLLADDSLALHEQWGAKLAEWLSIQPMFYLRPVDYGEIMVFAALGIISVVTLVFTYRTNRSVIAGRLLKWLLLSLLGLAVFGGFFDMLHIAVQGFRGLSGREEAIFNVIEDGGEMVIVSLALYFVYRITLKVMSKRHQNRT